MPWDVLGTVTSRIVNEVKHVNRVFYDCTGKPVSYTHLPAEYLGVDGGRILQIDAVGAAGEDDALGVLRLDDRQVGFVGIDFTVAVSYTHLDVYKRQANDRAGAKNTGLSNDKIMCRITIKTEGKIWRYLPWRCLLYTSS